MTILMNSYLEEYVSLPSSITLRIQTPQKILEFQILENLEDSKYPTTSLDFFKNVFYSIRKKSRPLH